MKPKKNIQTSVYDFRPRTWQKGVGKPPACVQQVTGYNHAPIDFKPTGKQIKYSTNHTIPRIKNYSIFGNKAEKFDEFI